ALEEVALLQWQLPIHFEHVHPAVDGIDVHQPYRAGNGFNRLEQFLFRANREHRLVMSGKQSFHIFQLHVIQPLNRRSHFWRGRIAQHQHNGLAVRPFDLVAFKDFGQIGGAEASYIVGLVHHYGNLPGGTRTREAECKQYRDQDPSGHVSAQITIASPCAASYRSNTCFLLRGLRYLPRPAAETWFAFPTLPILGLLRVSAPLSKMQPKAT